MYLGIYYMKRIVFISALFTLFATALGESQKDTQGDQETYEQLKKEFEELCHRPVSRKHFAWMARCEKNDECKQKTRENFNRIPREELTELLIDGVKSFDGECNYHEEREQEFELREKKIRDDVNTTNQRIDEYNKIINTRNRFDKICNFVVAGFLIGEGAFFAFAPQAPIYIKALGGTSLLVGIGTLFRVLW